MADTPIAPPLPSGSVDFNAIHAAARQGHDLNKALDEATFVHPDKAEAEKAANDAMAQSSDGAPVADLKPSDPPATKTGKSGTKEA